MRYSFHGHESSLDLRDVVAFEPDLCGKIARAQREPNVEDAVAVVLDLYGAAHVREQKKKLEVICGMWAQLARRAKAPTQSNEDERARIRAIPERLAWRFGGVWPEGRAVLHLMLRSVAQRSGCNLADAPLHIADCDVESLLESLTHGLRAGFANSIDAPYALELVQRAAGEPHEEDRDERVALDDASGEVRGADESRSVELDASPFVIAVETAETVMPPAPTFYVPKTLEVDWAAEAVSVP
jgi:hypothetical protein